MNKYYNKKIIIDGHNFDSKAEGNRYLELKLLLRANEIKDLILQPRYLLQPAFKKNGKAYRKIEYIADFQYIYKKTGKMVVEDVKGMETEVFRLKRKMFEYVYQDLELKLIK